MNQSSFSQKSILGGKAAVRDNQCTDEEILKVADAVSIDDTGAPCRFKIKDVRREYLRRNKYHCSVLDPLADAPSGAKVSSVLRSNPELFQPFYNQDGNVLFFFRANCTPVRSSS